MKWPNIDISLRDLHIYGGLGLAAVGGWQFSPAVTAVGLGIVLAILGVFAPRRAT